MALAPGTRLGPYEVTALIGVGGMGEVYRATDTNLKRSVAIKVLPASVAADTERLARFQREAEVLAALNHPNIAQIHGLEKSGGTIALVMELVEGPTLADRIAQGAIPLDEALPIAKQIAEALEAAHEHGIIHRDLKPANIKITARGAPPPRAEDRHLERRLSAADVADGVVKVLDFGLAKAMDPTGAMAASNSMSPTITTPAMTQAGMILGTAAYMSPEQARGTTVDKRADLWAFGVVLWEMLTGTRLFEGATVSDTLASVLKTEPDWSALAQATPSAIRRLLRRCLEKDRKRRLDSAADARLDIEEALTTPPEPVVTLAAQPRRADWRVALGAALLGAAVAATAATLSVRRSASDPVVTRLEISTPGEDAGRSMFALSPDGRRLAFVAGARVLAVRSLDQVGVQILAGTEGAIYPFWAPDSRTIGFAANGQLKRVDLSGGAPQVIAVAPFFLGGTWNADGVIVFAPDTPGSLMRVSAAGGTPVEVTHLPPGQTSHRWPQFLPDGRHFLFLGGGPVPGSTHGIYVASLDGGEPTRVVAAEDHAEYAPPGYLLRVSQGVLVAQRFDAARATLSGDPLPVAQAVGQRDQNLHSFFSVSAAGLLAHRSGGAGSGRRQLVWRDRAGKELGTVGAPDENFPSTPALAPDGQHVAYARLVQGNADVWVTDIGRNVATRFTFDPAQDYAPIWSPDGSRVVFRSYRSGGVSDLFVKPANGATDEQPLLVTPQGKQPLDWSRDGRFLLYANQDPKNQSDLWVLPLTGAADARKPFPVVQTGFDETQGQFSPDGRWLAYTSNESGREEIYVRPFPESGGKWQVSAAGGNQPRWGPDGKELFYVAADLRLMAVPMRATPEGRAVDAGTPLALFPTRLASGALIVASGWQSRAVYAVARDGRFLMNVNIDTAPANVPPLSVVLNWDAVLKK